MTSMVKLLLILAISVVSFRVRVHSRRLNVNRVQASTALTSQSTLQETVAEEVAGPAGPPLPARVAEVALRQAATEPKEPDDKTLMQTIDESKFAHGLPRADVYEVRIKTMMCLIFEALLGPHVECEPFVAGETTKMMELPPKDRQRVALFIQIGRVVRAS